MKRKPRETKRERKGREAFRALLMREREQMACDAARRWGGRPIDWLMDFLEAEELGAQQLGKDTSQ